MIAYAVEEHVFAYPALCARLTQASPARSQEEEIGAYIAYAVTLYPQCVLCVCSLCVLVLAPAEQQCRAL
jgi:hypothetical protein